MSILKVFSLVSLAIAFSACSAGEGDVLDSEAVSEAAESVVGHACSTQSNGPLPMCGITAEYCDVGTKCGSVGVCAAKPRVCTAVVDRVCGCDGKTYQNSCYAARAGVSVKKQGSCLGI